MKQLKVDAIKDGTVIDHIPGGKAIQVLKILNGTGKDTVSIGMNLPSGKYGRKDIVKIENHELSAVEVNRIAIIAPTASITIIRNYEITEKRKVETPEMLEDIAFCPNPNCVTNHEKVATVFERVRLSGEQASETAEYTCHYCEKIYNSDGLKIKVG